MKNLTLMIRIKCDKKLESMYICIRVNDEIHNNILQLKYHYSV